MSNLEDFFGGGGASGLIPTFPPAGNWGVASSSGSNLQLTGFVGNGDFVELPNTSNGSLEYTDDVGLVFSVSPTDINASADFWVSFRFDSVDSLIHCVAMDSVTDTLYLASINSTGTITPIGSGDTTTENIAENLHAWVGGAANSARSPSLIRASEGSGNFTVRMFNLHVELNESTGSIVTETSLTGIEEGTFEIDVNTHVSIETSSSVGTSDEGSLLVFLRENNTDYPDTWTRYEIPVINPSSLGLPSMVDLTPDNSNFGFLEWNGSIAIYLASVGTSGLRHDSTTLTNSFNTLLRNFNFI